MLTMREERPSGIEDVLCFKMIINPNIASIVALKDLRADPSMYGRIYVDWKESMVSGAKALRAIYRADFEKLNHQTSIQANSKVGSTGNTFSKSATKTENTSCKSLVHDIYQVTHCNKLIFTEYVSITDRWI